MLISLSPCWGVNYACQLSINLPTQFYWQARGCVNRHNMIRSMTSRPVTSPRVLRRQNPNSGGGPFIIGWRHILHLFSFVPRSETSKIEKRKNITLIYMRPIIMIMMMQISVCMMNIFPNIFPIYKSGGGGGGVNSPHKFVLFQRFQDMKRMGFFVVTKTIQPTPFFSFFCSRSSKRWNK